MTEAHTNPRRFIRHTADVSIEMRAVAGSDPGADPRAQIGGPASHLSCTVRHV